MLYNGVSSDFTVQKTRTDQSLKIFNDINEIMSCK